MDFGALEESETPRGEGGKQHLEFCLPANPQIILKAEAPVTAVYVIFLSLMP